MGFTLKGNEQKMIELYETDVDSFNSKHGIIQLDKDKQLSNKQKSLLSLAIRMAETSDMPQKHGAVIVKAGSVLAVGVNKWRNKTSSPSASEEYNPHLTYHAEIDALLRCSNAEGAVIYIARINKDGHHKFSRPCQRCMKAIRAAGIKKIIYTTETSFDY